MFIFNNSAQKKLRKKLRNDSTYTEKIFWQAIRKNQCYGVKFRRQCSVGKYIIDFYSFERKLAIEIDGDSHYSELSEKYDVQRTNFLMTLGITVVRFTNAEIKEDLEGCFNALELFLRTGNFPAENKRMFSVPDSNTPSNSP